MPKQLKKSWFPEANLGVEVYLSTASTAGTALHNPVDAGTVGKLAATILKLEHRKMER